MGMLFTFDICMHFVHSKQFHLIIWGQRHFTLATFMRFVIVKRPKCKHITNIVLPAFFFVAHHLSSFILTLECGEWSIILAGFRVFDVPYSITTKFFFQSTHFSLSFFTGSVVLMEVGHFCRSWFNCSTILFPCIWLYFQCSSCTLCIHKRLQWSEIWTLFLFLFNTVILTNVFYGKKKKNRKMSWFSLECAFSFGRCVIK